MFPKRKASIKLAFALTHGCLVNFHHCHCDRGDRDLDALDWLK